MDQTYHSPKEKTSENIITLTTKGIYWGIKQFQILLSKTNKHTGIIRKQWIYLRDIFVEIHGSIEGIVYILFEILNEGLKVL